MTGASGGSNPSLSQPGMGATLTVPIRLEKDAVIGYIVGGPGEYSYVNSGPGGGGGL